MAMNHTTSLQVGGKREANKVDKLARIKAAAQDLFVQNGYDDTTTREIAARAGVALGTVFTYASNKRDLLFLVANDLLGATREAAEESIQTDRSLLDNLIVFGAYHYRALGAQPALSKLILRELLFYDSGVQAVRAFENRALFWKNLESMIQSAHDRGEVALVVKGEKMARVLFAILQAEIRHWLALDDRDLVAGLAELWTSASLVICGISTQPVPSTARVAHLRGLVKSMDQPVDVR